jgi:predicted dehydrogenase
MLAALSLAAAGAGQCAESAAPGELRLITLDPGHFHAALFQKEMLPGVSPHASVYAPFGPDLILHLNRVVAFNLRKDNPTRWELDIHAAPDFMERMLKDRPGNVVVLSGRGRGKIARIQACVEAGLHILGDKPWILDPADLPLVEKALVTAEKQGVVAYDGMTQRFEISCILQREMVGDPAIFGSPLPGSETSPTVYMESVHHIMKLVAGAPNLRPVWFFDTEQYGEGLSDLGTHLVDLVQWTLFPDQALDWRKDIEVIRGSHWPTVLTREQFQRVTGETDFPDFLKANVKNDRLDYFCNDRVHYTIRGIRTTLDVIWNYEAPPGLGDTETAIFRGSRSRVDVLQGKEQNFIPELYVVPNRPEDKDAVLAAVRRKVAALQSAWPGFPVQDLGARIWVTIPAQHRVGHEAHFALLIKRFLGYVRDPKSLPAWEKPNMLAKYCVTTRGVELARQSPPGPSSGTVDVRR